MTDPYSRLNYRRLIAWPERIEREWPFFEKLLHKAPSNRLLDLGCGTGEHARFLVSKDFEVVGIDRSKEMLQSARDQPLPAGLELIEGDLRQLDQLVEGSFGGAICLGNTLPHLTDIEGLGAFLAAARKHLLSDATLTLQLLNYDRIFDKQERSLPVNFRHDPDVEGGEIVFLRLMDLRQDGTVGFFPTTLLFRPDHDPPLEVKATKRVEVRGWRSKQVEKALETAGFESVTLYGSYDDEPFASDSSRDLIVVAR